MTLFNSQNNFESFEKISKSQPDSINGFALEDLYWEHFTLENGHLDADRESDQLIPILAKLCGGLQGATVLELGSYEGYDSIALESEGVKDILSIEGNPANFLKCLVVKNHYSLNRTRYMLGDFTRYLESSQEKYDFILASGVLYHLFDPYVALDNIIAKTNRIGVCTTYHHPEISSGFKFTGKTRNVNYPGIEPLVLHERLNTVVVPGKKHGVESTAWMFDLDDLLRYFEYRNFKVSIFHHVEDAEAKRLRIRFFAERSS